MNIWEIGKLKRKCKWCKKAFETPSRAQKFCQISCQLMNSVRKGEKCWVWVGKKTNGKGIIDYKRTKRKIEEVSYESFIGEIGPDEFIFRTCMTSFCVNPIHLVKRGLDET